MPVMPAVTPAAIPMVPVMPAVTPAAIPMVPVVPAVTPAAIPMVPVMPTVAPTTVPSMPAPTTEMRVVVTVAVARLVPAMAPAVTDVSDLLNVRCLRGLPRNGDRHRGRGCARECNSAERGETDKCRNKFHDIHLLTPVGGGEAANGSAHYAGLMPMNDARAAFQSLIGPLRTTRSPGRTNLCRDGGSDENDVMVALSQPVVVLQAEAL
jgi:hypothetical protein